jgi:hypothetical protein
MVRWIFVLVQKGSNNAKKRKFLLCGTLKDWTKFTTQNMKQKRKSNF